MKIDMPQKLPFLESICWQIADVHQLTPEEMLNSYERGWKYREIFNNLKGEELIFLTELARNYNSWLQSLLMIFRFDFHQKILTVLESLNPELLANTYTYFGGGTLITLDFGEYRWSKDIDFISPFSASGYKHLRSIILDGGYEALFRDLSRIQVMRGTTDQYGIRMLVNVDEVPIKTEIIAESRFQLEPPRYPQWCPIPCLSINDCFTSKLLANSDRFMDDSVKARDLIDLAILRLSSIISDSAIAKAENAYEVIRPLKIAIERFQTRVDFREKCFSDLQIESSQIPRIIDGIDLLAEDFDLSATERTFKELHDILDF
jgi:Nucleotidyl transferase AbiEii toxin, Type IV TA system